MEKILQWKVEEGRDRTDPLSSPCVCVQLDLCVKPLKTLTLYEMLLDLMKEEEESLQQIRTSLREVTLMFLMSLNPSRMFKSVCWKFSKTVL